MLLSLLLLFQTSSPIPVPINDEPLTVPAIVYPAEAKALRVQGAVSLQIDVDATGHVTGVRALAGPERLRQAAVDAYLGATYRPVISKGKATPAIITTTVNFALSDAPPDTALALRKRFATEHARCQQLSLDKDAGALGVCVQAVDAGKALAPDAELEARAAAYNDVVLLLIAEGKKSRHLPEAGRYADQAVALVSGTSVHQPAIATAYITRAEVRSLAGNLKGAATDCETAEETLQTLLADEAENDKAGGYRGQMRELIELHAVILERDGKRDQAVKLRQRGSLI